MPLMSTQILEAPQTGTGEQHGASEEKPEEVYPACKKLEVALSAYQSAAAELEECRGKASKAEADMDMIGDSALSESESLEAISNAHGRKELYASRILIYERKRAALLQELRSSLIPAYNEVRAVVIRETERRIEILEGRVTEACGGLVESSVAARGLLGGLARQSKLVWGAQRHLPSQMTGLGNMAGEAAVAQSQAVLGNMEQIIPEIGREI